MVLKKNQAKLYEDVAWLFENADAKQNTFETHERSRGRDELRCCTVLTSASELAYLETHRWPGLGSVAKVTSKRTIKGQTTQDVRYYYLCSFKAEAEKLLPTVLAHWGIENKLHWTLDVVFNEDAHTYTDRRGAENMLVLRQFALNLLRQDPFKGSFKSKRKRAAWDDGFCARILVGLLIS